MEEIDIWRTARLLMKQRDDPEFFAAQRRWARADEGMMTLNVSSAEL